jgi:hypothetical protein
LIIGKTIDKRINRRTIKGTKKIQQKDKKFFEEFIIIVRIFGKLQGMNFKLLEGSS